jgi:hypothetical protein
MNIYLATRYTYRDDAAALARRIRALDLRVVSRWHDTSVGGEAPDAVEADLPDDVLDRIASGNHADLALADTLVLMIRPRMQGALLELGVALGRGLRVVLVGEPRATTAMVRHERVWRCRNDDECVETLARLAGRGRPL